jgi:hypothetical protein
LDDGIVVSDRSVPRRCRTCMEPCTLCDGKCWGFWKTTYNRQLCPTELDIPVISVGTIVQPGPHWNELRLGSKFDATSGNRLLGVVVELKTWGSGGTELDCVSVSWTNKRALQGQQQHKDQSPLIYRWGVIAFNGRRMYDLQLLST